MSNWLETKLSGLSYNEKLGRLENNILYLKEFIEQVSKLDLKEIKDFELQFKQLKLDFQNYENQFSILEKDINKKIDDIDRDQQDFKKEINQDQQDFKKEINQDQQDFKKDIESKIKTGGVNYFTRIASFEEIAKNNDFIVYLSNNQTSFKCHPLAREILESQLDAVKLFPNATDNSDNKTFFISCLNYEIEKNENVLLNFYFRADTIASSGQVLLNELGTILSNSDQIAKLVLNTSNNIYEDFIYNNDISGVGKKIEIPDKFLNVKYKIEYFADKDYFAK